MIESAVVHTLLAIGAWPNAPVAWVRRAQPAFAWNTAQWNLAADQADPAKLLLGAAIADARLGWLGGQHAGAVTVAARLAHDHPSVWTAQRWTRNPYLGRLSPMWTAYAESLVGLGEASRGRRCFVVTAWNPARVILDTSENVSRNTALEAFLSAHGLPFEPALGHSADRAWSEPSFALMASSRPQAVLIGRMFGQEAIFQVEADGTTEVVPCHALAANAAPADWFLSWHAREAGWTDERLVEAKARCEAGANVETVLLLRA
jgi:hypothetical protein